MTVNIDGTPKNPHSLPEGNEPLLAPLQISLHSISISPESIIVTGEELADGEGTVASINLRDHALAAPVQTLRLDGSSVTLMLTPAGFNKFGRLTFPAAITAKQK